MFMALFSCPKEVSITLPIERSNAAAREMDLLTYLRRFERRNCVHIGGDTYTLAPRQPKKFEWKTVGVAEYRRHKCADYLTTVEGVSF